MFMALALLFILTLLAGVFTFGLFSAPTFGGANIIFYFLLGLSVVAVIVALSQQAKIESSPSHPTQSKNYVTPM